MEQFQSLDVVNRNVEQSGINKEQFEALKDRLFDEYMKQQLIEDFFGELEDYVGPEATDEMRAVLAECENDEDIYAALSIPHELREKKFRDFELALETGHSTPAELMQSLVLLSKKYGFGIGYHTSPYDIKPDESGRWDVKATEQDHRDNDMPMAYPPTPAGL